MNTLRQLWRDRRGQSVMAEFLIVILVAALFLGIAMFLTKIRPAQVSVAAAARTCARQAGVSLNQARDVYQGQVAAYSVLQSAHLDPDRAQVTITPLGPWERFGQVQCRVEYTVNLRAVPFLRLFAPGSGLKLRATYTVSLDRYKSRWE